MLLCLTRDPDLRVRDLALVLGITERSAQKIIGDLVAAGYVTRKRVGRRNTYEIHIEMPLPLGRELTLRHMLETFRPEDDDDGNDDLGTASEDARPTAGRRDIQTAR
jgi:DNA-binding IclR family transcriptional regulator